MDFETIGQTISALVQEHFYDPHRARAWAAAHAHYAAEIDNIATFATVTNTALGQLQASHTRLYTSLDPEYYGLLAIFRKSLDIEVIEYESIAADLTSDRFIRVIHSGGPADQVGLQRGDKVLKADGRDFDPVLSFRGRSGQRVILTVERRAGQPTFEVQVFPHKVDPCWEWLEAQRLGSKLIEWRGQLIAYVPLFSCAGDEYQATLQEAIIDKFWNARALILDLRDGWGGCNPDLLNPFNPIVPVLSQIDRDGKQHRLDTQWRKPLYILINAGTRSGKEIIVYAVKKHNLGTLIGQRTAGAVMGGRCYLLPDKSLLYLAIADIEVDGQHLEGQGIFPHVEVPDALPFAEGSDPQLEKALEVATT